MIMFSDDPQSILKAYMLSRLTGDTVITEGSDDLMFFSGDAVISTDSYDLHELAQQYKGTYCRNTDWLHTYRGNELMSIIYKALRHSSRDKYSIIFKAVEDAFTKGIEYCLKGASVNSKKLNSLCWEVNHEVYRMMGFIRFKPAGEKCLVAEPLLFHSTVDLILREFQSRYPNHRVVLLSDFGSKAIENGKVFEVRKEDYQKYLKDDIYDDLWEEYYRSQYIEPRKNMHLAAAKIPKKYWNWMQEGKILKSEK